MLQDDINHQDGTVDITLPSGRDGCETLRQLAGFQLRYGQIRNAEHLLRVAYYLAPDDGQTLRLLAHVMARSGRAMEAGKFLVKAREDKRTTVTFADFKTVGLALLKEGRKTLGIKLLGNKIELDKI